MLDKSRLKGAVSSIVVFIYRFKNVAVGTINELHVINLFGNFQATLGFLRDFTIEKRFLTNEVNAKPGPASLA